jgi:ubiquinone/menaquinone biosynthesis C-methylase UbiE
MSDRHTGIARGFRDVDAHAQDQDFSAYLERLARVMAAEKAGSYDLLHPSPGRQLLDVGCGNGDDVRALAARVAPTGRVIGIDHTRTMIDKARAAGVPAGAEFHVADAHELPFADASVDAARVERTLQHVADPVQVLAEMARVVRPGGVLVASEPDWGTLAIDAAETETTRAVLRALCDDHIQNGWIGRQLTGNFTRLGLQAIDVHPVTLVLRSFPVALDILGLADAAEPRWLADLRERHGRGAFFASMTGFTVTGRVVGARLSRTRASSALASKTSTP